MPAQRRGMAEAGQAAHKPPPLDLTAAVAAAVAQARTRAGAHQASDAATLARSAAARRAEEKRLRDRTRRWVTVRARLRAVVEVVDRELTREGITLSMADSEAHPCDVAAVEIRASLLGRPAEPHLEIVAGADLALRGRIVDGARRGEAIRLPATASRATAEHFGRAIVAYLDVALVPHRPERRVCRRCAAIVLS